MYRKRLAAAAFSIAVLGAACSSTSSSVSDSTTTTPSTPVTTVAPATTTTIAKAQEVTVHPLFVRGSGPGATGGVGTSNIGVQESQDDTVRIDFSEDEPAGFGDSSRAAAWSSVTVATLLTGSPLEGTYRFTVSGAVDGPSAGALGTVAVLSLQRNDALEPGITMTGTINPDGTVGPVGGIPQKIEGAAAEGMTKVLIPAGQRNSASAVDGELVDVVELGRRSGVEVVEVVDVYEAYEHFTGKPLPRQPEQGRPQLDGVAYTRLKAKADSALADYQQSAAAFGALAPEVQELLIDVAIQGEELATRSADLSRQGLQAGAFTAANQASMVMSAAARSGEAVQVLLTQGTDAFFATVSSSQAIEGQVYAFFDSLKTASPRTVSDASSLMYAYASAFDALSVSMFAGNQINSLEQAVYNGELTIDEALPQLIIPLVYYEISGKQVEVAEAVYDVGRDLGGPEIDPTVDLAPIADFFRKGSDATFHAFETNVVKRLSERYGRSEDVVLGALANADLGIALSLNQRMVLEGLTNYIGDGEPNAEYARMGFAMGNYARNASLVAKYYANGELDEEFNLVGVRYETALTGGLDLARRQLSASIASLRGNDIEPAMQVALYESAGVEREQGVSEKFDALTDYWGGYISARVLAYVGGFPTDGLTASA